LTENGAKAMVNSILESEIGLTEVGVNTMVNLILDFKIALMHDIHSRIDQVIKDAKCLDGRFVSMEECLDGLSRYFKDGYAN